MERSFYALEYGHYGAFFHQSKLRGRSESSQTALTPQNVYLAIESLPSRFHASTKAF